MKTTFLRAWANGTWDTDTLSVPVSLPYAAIVPWYCEQLPEYPHVDSDKIVLVAVLKQRLTGKDNHV